MIITELLPPRSSIPSDVTGSKLAPITAARRGLALSPLIHGLGSVSMYALEVMVASLSDGCGTGTCGASTLWCKASAAFTAPAAIDALNVCPILPFTDPTPTNGPPGT